MPLVDPRFIVQILLQIPDEATVDAVRTYAVSRLPADYDRLFAHIALRGAGLVDPEEPASIWLGGRRLSMLTPALMLSTPTPRMHSSEVQTLLRDAAVAQRENALSKAIDLYRRAIVIDPAVIEAEQNLGTALILAGRADEGEAHIKRSLELDGHYAVARCNLAALELSRGQPAEAASYVAPLDTQRQMTLEEAVAYLRTKAEIARAEGDGHRSEELLHCLLAFDHDNALALELLARHGAPAAAAG
jgi:tetratricopeptide (TPR) repeat protein